MDDSTRRLLVTTSVFTGALILTGPATFLVVFQALAAVATVAGLGPAFNTQIGTILAGVPAVLLAGEVVSEVTALQLYGVDSLSRGTRNQRIVRHGSLLLVVVAALVFIGAVVFTRINPTPDSPPTVLIGVALAVVALLWGAGRSAMAFRRGLEGTGR